jgi:hypothetical protein
MKFILNYIRKEEWSPYVAGILLGLVGIGAVWTTDKLLGASGAFENLAGMIGKALAPKAFDNMYFNFIMPPGITWGLILLVGVFFGGMLGAATSGTLLWGKKGSANSDAQWKRIFGPQIWKRWWLHKRSRDLWRNAVGSCRFPLHYGNVRFRNRHRSHCLSKAVLGSQGDHYEFCSCTCVRSVFRLFTQ